MLKSLQRLFPVALTISLAACGGAGSTGNSPSALPAITSSTSQAAPAAAGITDAVASTTAGSVVWQAGNAQLGRWAKSNTYQCGSPAVSGATFNFTLSRSGTSCGRNQASPMDANGNNSRLTDGRQYTWSFRYVDGTSAGSRPGMGYDRDARSSIFQVHAYGGGNACTGLGFYNGGVVGAAQKWYLSTCSGYVWSGSYTAGEKDDWTIVMVPSQSSSGNVKLYRNGALVANVNGANYSNSGGGNGGPWWNFGPYKWRWELANGGGSSMTQINASIQNMTLTVR